MTKHLLLLLFLFLSVLASAQTRYEVSSREAFNAAQFEASAGDTIVWEAGVYTNVRMDVFKEGLVVTAEPYGSVIFTGVSRAVIEADHTTFSGFQYVGGYIGTLHVITNSGSDVLISHVNIQNYTSHKYLIVDANSRRTTISHCNFENRINRADQNILSILVDNEPGYHKIQHCSFKNFAGLGNDEGVEPIRIGVSSQSERDSRTLVEYCYFTQCSGDGEIISHKARQNVYRYNTFANNPVAELVLRHGDEGIVYGNFFLNNMGGIRVREGSGHFIYNNYFQGLSRRAIYLQNDPSDPLSDIHIYHNTIIGSEELRLGSNGSNPPANVVIANNIFANPLDRLFTEATGNEMWMGNLTAGTLGIERPSIGLSDTDPGLVENAEGFFQPNANSPVIATASTDYPAVPLYPEMDYDNELMLDLMQESRPLSLADRAIGASEFSATVQVQPHANELNTGPAYLFDSPIDYLTVNAGQLNIGGEEEQRSVFVSSNLDWSVSSSVDWISTDLSSGTGDAGLRITIDTNQESFARSGTVTFAADNTSVTIEVNQDAGMPVSVNDLSASAAEVFLFPNPTSGNVSLKNIPNSNHSLLVELFHLDGRRISAKEYQTPVSHLAINVDHFVPGTYLMKVTFMGEDGTAKAELTRKFVRE